EEQRRTDAWSRLIHEPSRCGMGLSHGSRVAHVRSSEMGHRVSIFRRETRRDSSPPLRVGCSATRATAARLRHDVPLALYGPAQGITVDAGSRNRPSKYRREHLDGDRSPTSDLSDPRVTAEGARRPLTPSAPGVNLPWNHGFS